jgi:hypothetical protein
MARNTLIFFASFLAMVGAIGAHAGDTSVEVLPSESANTGFPDAGDAPLRVQVQLVWDGVAGKLERRRYEFADPFPAQYDVHYLPLDPSRDRAGLISGQGVMTWRMKSDVRFGEDAIMAQYRGHFVEGRFEGEGALLIRGGFRYDGSWKNGRMEGQGQLLLPNGDAYTGGFFAGKEHGQGQYISATGQIYEGGFASGLRDGKGVVTEPGRHVYSSVWRGGHEDLGLRRMLPGHVDLAQSSASAPDLAVSLSAAATTGFCCYGTKALLSYVSTSYPDRLRIFPDAPQMLEIWRGNQNIVIEDTISFDWDRAGMNQYSFRNYVADSVVPVGLQLGLENLGTAPANVVGAYVDVSKSELDGEPALQSIQLKPLSVQNLAFSIENYGWAAAENAKLSFSYVNPKSGKKSERLEIPIGDIKSVHQFSFVETMVKLGADAKALPHWAEGCAEQTEVACFKKIKNSGSLGKLTDYVFTSERKFGFQAEGSVDFSWRDNKGTPVSKSVPFSAFIPLGTYALSGGECEGAGEEESAVLRKPFELKIDGTGYRVPLPIKGDVNQGVLKRWGIKLNVQKSSRHRFTIVFELADGRLARSRPVDLEFFRPQTFPNTIRPFEPRC